MQRFDYKRIYAIKKQREERILKVCPNCTNDSGIYFLTRKDGDGFKFAYIGQAKHVLSRLGEHLTGYQHIDLSIKKHGLYDTNNPYGYQIGYISCDLDELDEKERYFIKKYADAGYQLRNATIGGQGEGKKSLGNAKPVKNYYDGLSQGYKNAQKFVKDLFDKHLDFKGKKEPPTKNQEKAVQKFEDFLKID